ncbi:MAG: cytochrome c [Candidatus Aminicenantes bacterium]|nr:cytochrome c [Candidatus Aminicenantes bacterium]MDH5466895.1 cytochrome c [Candidatus Aminicenantes bacterium]MDH5706426.1 cytochrome c [Candidatus Aminicenantes bacterium]
MSLFVTKSIIAGILFIAGLFALLTMLSLMGKTERKASPKSLRRLHKIFGFIFTILILVNSYLGMKYWTAAGDQLSTRAVFHGILALALLIILILKIVIVQFYNQFLRFAPVMGITVFALSFVVFSTSAGYFLLRTICAQPETSEFSTPSPTSLKGNVERGVSLFNNKCASCHYADKEEARNGPGLKNLLKRENLPSSNRSATVENILLQLKKPWRVMPSFTSFLEQELIDLMAYMKTL